MKFVIDTNILIDKFRGGKEFDIFLAKLDKDSELYLPSIVFFELFSGKSSKKERVTNDILSLKKTFHLVDMTLEIAKKAGAKSPLLFLLPLMRTRSIRDAFPHS